MPSQVTRSLLWNLGRCSPAHEEAQVEPAPAVLGQGQARIRAGDRERRNGSFGWDPGAPEDGELAMSKDFTCIGGGVRQIFSQFLKCSFKAAMSF